MKYKVLVLLILIILLSGCTVYLPSLELPKQITITDKHYIDVWNIAPSCIILANDTASYYVMGYNNCIKLEINKTYNVTFDSQERINGVL